MSDVSIYPDAIDGYAQLPLVIDTVTRVDAVTVNRLRSAIINIETELGVLPSGEEYDTVRGRLDALEARLNDLELQIGNIRPTEVDTINTSVTLESFQNIILADATSGPLIVTLPDAAEVTGRFDIKKIDASGNTVTIATQLGQTIDGSAGIIINVQNDSYTLISDLANWFII